MRVNRTAVLLIGAITVALACGVGVAQDAPKELQPRPVKSLSGDMTIDDALTQLQQQTGSRVVDRRTSKTQDKVSLKLDKLIFWQALDEVVKATNGKSTGISLYEVDGRIALIDRPTRSLATTHSGIFRISVKHLGVSRDADNDKPQLTANLEFAWEPRFQPFLLAIEELNVKYAPDANNRVLKAAMKGGGTKIRVSGRNAFEEVVRLEAPERSSPRITSLTGKIRLIGPVEMQTLVVSPLPDKDFVPEQDKEAFLVTVRPVRKTITKSTKKWFVEVDIAPKARLPMFESHHQHVWLENIRAHLESVKGKKSTRIEASSRDVSDLSGGIRRVIHGFDMSAGLGKLEPADWKLTIVTPGRIVDFVVPFEFKAFELP